MAVRSGLRAVGGLLVTLLLASLLAACTSSTATDLAAPPGLPLAATSTTQARPVVTTTTTKPPVPRAPPDGFGPGDHDKTIRWAEWKLLRQRYHVGQFDDTYDQDTTYAVVAFQKVHGMERTGRMTQDVLDRLATSTSPELLVPDGGPQRVEIDLPRQVLFLVEDNKLVKILPISSGSGRRYCEHGHCGTAITRTGDYRVAYSRRGWVHSDLGWLYNPVYYDARRGIAIHGSKSVPAQPVSHGCVRIPMSAAEWFPDHATPGTPVFVRA